VDLLVFCFELELEFGVSLTMRGMSRVVSSRDCLMCLLCFTGICRS
jgi:hypothetical protein